MSNVVVDASVALAWCFPDEGSDYADQVLVNLKRHSIAVPAVWSLEVANGILVGERRKRLHRREIQRFVVLLESLSIWQDAQAVSETVNHVLPLASRYGLSAYDGAYLELAMRQNAPLATLDTRLRESASRAGVPIFS